MLAAALRPILRPVCRVAFRPDVHGAHHIPRTGPVILAANHLSFVDSFLIPLMTPRRVSFLAKAEYFAKPGLTRAFMTGIDAVPVPRGEFRAAQQSLEVALEILRAGGAFGIHPEGTRSRDGRLYRGRTGVGWLALASRAPVIPTAILGSDKVQPVGAAFPRPGRVVIHFGKPLLFDAPQSGKSRRAATDEIMSVIAEMSGQEVVDSYSPTSTS